MRYIAEPLGSEIFLMRKSNTQIVFTTKISRSTVLRIHSQKHPAVYTQAKLHANKFMHTHTAHAPNTHK